MYQTLASHHFCLCVQEVVVDVDKGRVWSRKVTEPSLGERIQVAIATGGS